MAEDQFNGLVCFLGLIAHRNKSMLAHLKKEDITQFYEKQAFDWLVFQQWIVLFLSMKCTTTFPDRDCDINYHDVPCKVSRQ